MQLFSEIDLIQHSPVLRLKIQWSPLTPTAVLSSQENSCEKKKENSFSLALHFENPMSHYAFHSHSEYVEEDDETTSTFQSTVIVRELDDMEANALLTGEHPATAPDLSPSMLKMPTSEYEILSSAGTEDEEEEEEEDYDEDLEWIQEHWFPSLSRNSWIELLDDEEDEIMYDPMTSIIVSAEEADIEEIESQDEEGMSNFREAISGKRRRSPTRQKRHRKKRTSSDETNGGGSSVPIEVIYSFLE